MPNAPQLNTVEAVQYLCATGVIYDLAREIAPEIAKAMLDAQLISSADEIASLRASLASCQQALAEAKAKDAEWCDYLKKYPNANEVNREMFRLEQALAESQKQAAFDCATISRMARELARFMVMPPTTAMTAVLLPPRQPEAKKGEA